MKKAVISTGSKQYLVSEGQELLVEKLSAKKAIDLEPLMVIDGDKIEVGTPVVSSSKVSISIADEVFKGDKVVAIRYKAKKRVNKVHGHRQEYSLLTVQKIS